MSADGKRIASIAKQAARAIGHGRAPDIAEVDRIYLAGHPATVRQILEELGRELAKSKRRRSLIAAYLWMFESQLQALRYWVGRDRAWAADLIEHVQERMLAMTRDRAIAPADWQVVLQAFREARIPVRDDVRRAVMSGGEAGEVAAPIDPEAVRAQFDQMLGALEELNLPDPFGVVQALDSAVGNILPAPLRAVVACGMATKGAGALREAAPLFLLDPSRETRVAMVEALARHVPAGAFSPTGLRRLATIRAWLPEGEHPGLDALVGGGGVPAAWPKPIAAEFHASLIDGAGAQEIFVVAQAGRDTVLCGLLFKQDHGLADAWCDHTTRTDAADVLERAASEVPILAVGRDYFDRVMRHGLWLGTRTGEAPPVAVLELAELIGGADWLPHGFDPAAAIAELAAAAGPEPLAEAAVAATLAASGEWLSLPFADSWYEDGGEVFAAVAGARTTRAKGVDAMEAAVIALVLEPRRHIWLERFALMALWARSATAGHARVATDWATPAWTDFLVLARELLAGRPLADVPLMRAIASRTVMAAVSGDASVP